MRRMTHADPASADPGERRHLARSRWAAVGAAVAVAVGAGGAVRLAGAAGDSAPSSIVSITPARVLDTRDPTNLGLSGPFVSPTGQLLQVTGSVATPAGNAVVVPTGATGVMLNVTAVNPSANGFVSVRPAGTPGAPTTSNLNVLAGAVTPNAVFVALPTSGGDAGKIEITFDALGTAGPTTDMLVDVVGYTTEAVAPKQFSLPITGAATDTVTFSGALPGGLRFEDNPFGTYDSIDHSFVIPADYTTGTPISVDLTWVIGADCRPSLERNNLTVARAGIPRISGPSTSAGLSIADTVTATANVVNTTTMTIVSPDPTIPLQAGDSVVFGVFRRGDSSGETCVGPDLILTGINVRYS